MTEESQTKCLDSFWTETVGELELRRYNSIVEQHGDQLEEVIEALGPHPAPPWDPACDPVRLKVVSHFCLVQPNVHSLSLLCPYKFMLIQNEAVIVDLAF